MYNYVALQCMCFNHAHAYQWGINGLKMHSALIKNQSGVAKHLLGRYSTNLKNMTDRATRYCDEPVLKPIILVAILKRSPKARCL